MHIKTSASYPLAASGKRFGYREALAEMITELGQTTVARHDRPRRRRSPTAGTRVVKQRESQTHLWEAPPVGRPIPASQELTATKVTTEHADNGLPVGQDGLPLAGHGCGGEPIGPCARVGDGRAFGGAAASGREMIGQGGTTMPVMAATDEHRVPRLAPDASLGEVIEAVNELAAESAKRRYDAARERLDDPHPSASIVISNEAYDALLERLDAPPRPNERLRRTMLGPGA